MKQLRTYILITGRDDENRPVRRLVPYNVPLPGMTDNLEALSNTRLRSLEAALTGEAERIRLSLADIHVEKMRRLEAIT